MADTPPPPPPPTTPPAAPVPGSGNPAHYASWGKRVLSYIVDYVPVLILSVIAWMLVNSSYDSIACTGSVDQLGSLEEMQKQGLDCTTYPGFAAGAPLAALAGVLALVYWLWNRVYRMGKSGSSLGMGVVGTKAVKESTGQPLGFGLNLLRQILLAVDFWICYIGVLWPLWDSKRQCLISDKATGAVVIPTS